MRRLVIRPIQIPGEKKPAQSLAYEKSPSDTLKPWICHVKWKRQDSVNLCVLRLSNWLWKCSFCTKCDVDREKRFLNCETKIQHVVKGTGGYWKTTGSCSSTDLAVYRHSYNLALQQCPWHKALVNQHSSVYAGFINAYQPTKNRHLTTFTSAEDECSFLFLSNVSFDVTKAESCRSCNSSESILRMIQRKVCFTLFFLKELRLSRLRVQELLIANSS